MQMVSVIGARWLWVSRFQQRSAHDGGSLARSALVAVLLLLLAVAAPAFAQCPGCCSGHGGITQICSSNGRIRCMDGTTSPTCLCSTCGVSTTPTSYSLSVARAGAGFGLVTSSPSGINCGTNCSASFSSGSTVTLTATPDSGSVFGGWSTCTGLGTCSVAMNQTRSTTATFNAASASSCILLNDVAMSGLGGGTGSTLLCTVEVPSGASNFMVRTSGGTGDPNLYVRLGLAPTTSVYDCRGISFGPDATCAFVPPASGTFHVLVHGASAYAGLTLRASWQSPASAGVDEPAFGNVQLPLPTNPPFPNCPGGYFVAAVDDGPGAGMSPGIFGLELVLNAPGTQRLEGGLNFGGLIDGSQVGFAGFNFQNPANEPQRLDLILTGGPSSSYGGTLPVRIKVIRQPSAGVNELVLETTANLTMATQTTRTINLTPSFYVITVAPEGSASVAGGAADGQVYVSLTSQFVDRPGGGFFGGVVVGGYHAAHPFGGVSGFASFCLGSQHVSSARLYSAPTYGTTGARDLRLRLIDHANRELIRVPQ